MNCRCTCQSHHRATVRTPRKMSVDDSAEEAEVVSLRTTLPATRPLGQSPVARIQEERVGARPLLAGVVPFLQTSSSRMLALSPVAVQNSAPSLRRGVQRLARESPSESDSAAWVDTSDTDTVRDT
mmetsp:Transcript_28444/g.75091  ORF Transcript_28444/g.75091 Transcript_28444/m.75091 type:complete len:126 (+) Transcript_28444:826-1203(+)